EVASPYHGRLAMKKLMAVVACTALAVCIGCNQNKSAPGGPGAPGGSTSSRSGATKADTFTITPPSGTTDIKEGQSKEITISLNRGRDFKQNVKLTLSTDAKGLTIKPDTAELKAADTATSVKFTLEAAKDAATGEHVVTVKASPEGAGESTQSSFKVNVT